MTHAEIAQGILDLIPSHRQWCKGIYYNGTGRRCLYGAGLAWNNRNPPTKDLGAFWTAYLRKAKKLYPDLRLWMRSEQYGEAHVTRFNDESDYKMVRAVLEAMISGE